jgi:phosphate starvation-inducible protein PhoH and related proteins
MASSKQARKRQVQEHVEPVQRFQSIQAKNLAQQLYLEAIERSDVVFGIGSAGTGKTYVAASYAAEKLYYREIDKIVVTRPNVEASRSLGFLPGELEEKYAPYLEPFEGVFIRAFGKSLYELFKKRQQIEPKPLGFMRGATFDNAIVLVDECQNMTEREFKLLLTRIGENTKVIFSGDSRQVDIPDSGLMTTIERLKRIPSVETIEFYPSDIVRSELCKSIIMEYER